MCDDVAAKLLRYLNERWPERRDPAIRDMRSISAGWESDVYAFDLEHGPSGARARMHLVLRVYPGDRALAKSSREFRGMRLLAQAGYPVPRVHLLEQAHSPLGQPFVVMDRVEGTPMWPQLWAADPARAQALVGQFCALQRALHTLDWRPWVPDPARYEASPHTLVDRAFADLDEWLALTGLSDYAATRDWLAARRDGAACDRPAVVHWDLHPENVLLHPDGSAVVIDWTQVTISDARFDLAWTLLVIGCSMGDAWRARFLTEYERLAGCPMSTFDFFDVYACLKRLLIVSIVVHRGPASLGLRDDVLATMRRQVRPLRWVYDHALALTGLAIPDVEEILQSFGA